MEVRLIKRNKITHCGVKVKHWGEVIIISICNGRWVIDDKVTEGDEKEVTCKRCLKRLATADENGIIKL